MDKPEEDIVYTDHALRRMLVRGITREMVRATLVSPEQTGTGYKSRTLAYNSFGDRRIKVVYSVEDKRFVIISVMWD